MRTDKRAAKPSATPSAKSAPPASVLDVLARDHREIDRLFDQVGAAQAGAARDAAFGRLKDALVVHARLEEAIVYPALRTTSDEKLLRATSEAFAEHREVKLVLAELSRLPSGSERFAQKFAELRTRVVAHVREEEGAVFRWAREALGDPRLRALGRRVDASRPVPKAAGITGVR
jgi:hemerythrin superfamily protein